MDHRAIIRIAQAQHGLIARHQALDAGATRHTIQAMLTAGQWERVHDGVYIVGASERTWKQRVMAACLAAGLEAMAGFRTAARLHEVVTRSGRLELLTDGNRRVRLPGVQTHRTVHLLPEDRTIVDGIPCTSLARTLIDLAPQQTEVTLGRWIDRGIQMGALDVHALERRTTELTMPGRPRTITLMRALVLRADDHDPGRSVFEARVIEAATRRSLPALERQHPVERPDGTNAFIDLAHPPSKVAVELDGWETHGVRSAFEPDRIRGNDLLLLGWELLRFTWMMDDDYICDTIRTAIELKLADHHHSISGHTRRPQRHR